LSRNAWYVSGTWQIGAASLRAGFSKAGEGKGSALETVGFFRSGPGTSANQLTLGVDYALSPRTSLYTYYSRIANDDQAIYDFAINELGISAGARPSVLALGMRHTF
jgi:predicted porin